MKEVEFTVDVEELKIYMVRKKLDKIIDLSNASGVDRNILGKVINGTTRPSTTTIEKLIRTLEIPEKNAGSIFFKLNLRNT